MGTRKREVKNRTVAIYNTAIGDMMICSDGAGVTEVKLVEENIRQFRSQYNSLTDEAAGQLEEYFLGKRRVFDFPISFATGTEFQRIVWNYLLTIPYGETRSYKQVAEAIGRPKAYRAVGMANNKNPLMIVVPCHRVIGADKSLTGYAGGLELKKRLLQLEYTGCALSALEKIVSEQLGD